MFALLDFDLVYCYQTDHEKDHVRSTILNSLEKTCFLYLLLNVSIKSSLKTNKENNDFQTTILLKQ